MTITSFYFLLFYLCILLLYYLIPRKMQWILLLFSSILFYLLAGKPILILYPICASCVCIIGIQVIGKTQNSRHKKIALLGVVVSLVGILFVLKYVNFGINTVNGICALLGKVPLWRNTEFLVPLGISYYTFSLLGYVIDVYNGIAQPNRNGFQITLYGIYFPVMTMGPILRYREDGAQFFQGHRFDYVQVTRGMQRMLWGFFKKLVIAERMALVVSSVYQSWEQYDGFYIWVGTFAFAFQLYTDFSGAMDIVLGISQSFGIILPENFERPFFAQSISEYWRKWHITLGVWMKEYIFYPVLRTEAFGKLSKQMRAHFGKKRGKQITTFAAMLILWFTVGIWHGGDWKYVIGSGLLHWFYIVGGELLSPFYARVLNRLHIDSNAAGLRFLRRVRTFLLVNIGFIFFRADSVQTAWKMLGIGLTNWNFRAFIDGSLWGTLFSLGLNWIEFTIAIVSLLILLVVSILQEKGIKIQERISKKRLPVRWAIWYALLFYTILLGYYGPGYSAAEFIYQGF